LWLLDSSTGAARRGDATPLITTRLSCIASPIGLSHLVGYFLVTVKPWVYQ
jgi:hypothetical protein